MALIQAMAMSSGLGSLVQACAAFRAGIAAFAPSPDFESFDPGDEEPQPVMISAVPIATFGFSGTGRLIAVAHEMLSDLGAGIDLARLSQAAVYLALPDPEERGIDSFQDEADEAARIEALGSRVLDQASRNLDLRWSGPRRFFGGGNTAFARALRAAVDDLGRSSQRACVVAGLDSLVTPKVLEALADEGRLKTANNPVGMIPGEAGAVLVLSNEPAPKQNGPRVRVRSTRLGPAPPRDDDTPPDGRPLASCALDALGAARAEPLFLVADHNGEAHRATEWGLLQMHLRAQHEALGAAPAWFPVMSFGDVGAASGAVGACVGARALQHGHAPAPRCLVLSSSDRGERSAIVLETDDRS